MTFKMHALSGYGLMLALALIFSGCAASHQEIMARDHLARARTAYTMAKADPIVAANAPIPLMDAGKTLEAAEQARDFNEMNHLTYIAEKQTHIAAAMARIKVARQKSGELRRENDQMLEQLNARAQSAVDPEASMREDRAKAEEERRQSRQQGGPHL
ncbi:DUF4398 domain-containing protein [Desulfococcus sp.]|uniref:DUF4398 domain-containing protein n=1 Tax=Desulfococcus sp. TaxID=2025834 RepID=UPI003593A121